MESLEKREAFFEQKNENKNHENNGKNTGEKDGFLDKEF
jgi:hypothetical protein